MDRAITRLMGRQKLYKALGDKLFDEGSSKIAREVWNKAAGLQEAIDILEDFNNGKREDENGKGNM